ncbi:MAG: hypothetical protein BroJett042_12360 [Bacteroidota bacterium]|nr:MAG: hypothetical protein BroJett042_12360 [Bacteroidota bacterium]
MGSVYFNNTLKSVSKSVATIVGLLISIACSAQKSEITIVDIGNLDRTGLSNHLAIVNKFSPKVIGLYFLLTTDSLEEDLALVQEIAKGKNIIQSSKLHNNNSKNIYRWDSLEMYHLKFRHGESGFSNLTLTDDSVLVYELPMRQFYRKEIVQAFSYEVAYKYDSNLIRPMYKKGVEDFTFKRNFIDQFFKVISVPDLLAGNFDKKDLANKIVLLGHVDDPNSFYTDHTRLKKISGVEVQACLIQSIMK